MTLAEELRAVVDELDRCIDEARRVSVFRGNTNVYAAQDENGRPLLGDLLAAKANALAALALSDRLGMIEEAAAAYGGGSDDVPG